MSENRAGKGTGKKATRTVTVTVRLEPKLRYLSELAARKQRRTISSYIEWAVEKSLEGVLLYRGGNYGGDDPISVLDEAEKLWDVDAAERFARLGLYYPELLTHEEQEEWKLLMDSRILSPAFRPAGSDPKYDEERLHRLIFPKLRDLWREFKAIAELDTEEQREWVAKMKRQLEAGTLYPELAEQQPKTDFDDLDDDIPF